MNMFRAFIELDKLSESYMSRQEIISDLTAAGKRYDFDKYTDAQLYRIWEKTTCASEMPALPNEKVKPSRKRPTCATCNTELTDGGFCPRCDDGVEDFDESLVNKKKSCRKSARYKRMIESWETEFLAIDGFTYHIEDTFEDEGYIGYEVVYSKDGKDIVKAEIWEDDSYVTVIENLYAPNLMQHTYETFTQFAEDLVYKCDNYLTESNTSNNKAIYMCDSCGLEIELSEEEFDGCCPRCHDHTGGFGICEESLSEAIPANWVNYKGAWIYPIDSGFEANLDGLHYEAATEEELKAIIDTAIKDGYTKDKKLAQYLDKPSRISHRAIWENTNLFENWADDKMEELLNTPRNTWTEDDWADYYYCLNAEAEQNYFDSLDEAIDIKGTELSTQHAVIPVVDQIKMIYEAGFFSKLPVGRENAFTVDIYGPDKDRLVGYFKKQPEFNYEMNTDQGIISHEFISSQYDIEIFDEFISMYRIPQNESLKEAPFLNKWVTSSGDNFTWGANNQQTTSQQPVASSTATTAQATGSLSYILSSNDAATASSDEFLSFEDDDNWYGEIRKPELLNSPYSFFTNLKDAVAKAEENIKSIALPWFDLHIYEYDDVNKTVTLVQSIKAQSVLSQQSSGGSNTSNSGHIVEIVWDSRAGKLRARADDGVHGPANVAFPNNLRTRGAKYRVDTLIWNGKNYRASGQIIPV